VQMRSAFAVAALLVLTLVMAQLDYQRVHLVDHNPQTGNYLFRGNIPTNSSGVFDYMHLTQYMAQRASDAGVPLPSAFYLVDITLMDNLNKAEVQFWQNAPADLGELVEFGLGGAKLPPWHYSHAEILKMAVGPIWSHDKLPERMNAVNQWMNTANASGPWVMYAHCQYGCDRTGEFIAAYRMQWMNSTLADAYAKDTTECGRKPDTPHTYAIDWYCWYYEITTGLNIGDCNSIKSNVPPPPPPPPLPLLPADQSKPEIDIFN